MREEWNGWNTRVVLKDNEGHEIISQIITLTVKQPIEILVQPDSVAVENGRSFSLKVAAEGKSLSYQWQYSKDNGKTGKNWSNGTQSILTKTMLETWNGWMSRVIITDSRGNTPVQAAH